MGEVMAVPSFIPVFVGVTVGSAGAILRGVGDA
jgi:hypothetical protein